MWQTWSVISLGTWYLYWRCLQGENEIYYYGVDLTSSRCQYPVCSVVWSVSTVINDVDDYWQAVEVWLLWHLTSSLVNISPSLGTKHPVSSQRVNIISSSFTSERETPLTAAKPINTSVSKPQVTNIWEISDRQESHITRSIWNR